MYLHQRRLNTTSFIVENAENFDRTDSNRSSSPAARQFRGSFHTLLRSYSLGSYSDHKIDGVVIIALDNQWPLMIFCLNRRSTSWFPLYLIPAELDIMCRIFFENFNIMDAFAESCVWVLPILKAQLESRNDLLHCRSLTHNQSDDANYGCL